MYDYKLTLIDERTYTTLMFEVPTNRAGVRALLRHMTNATGKEQTEFMTTLVFEGRNRYMSSFGQSKQFSLIVEKV